MRGIDPVWITVVATIVAIDQNIGSGHISLVHVFPDAWIPWIVAWCGFLAGILGFVLAALTTLISNKPGLLIPSQPPSITPTVVKVLLIAFALSFLVANHSFASVP